MHSITFDTTAGILLLSSVFSLGLLLKRTPQSHLTSSTSILSISDISSSVLTALILFFHQIYINDGNVLNQLTNKTNHSIRIYDTTAKDNIHHSENFSNFVEHSLNENCDFKSVFFQYIMFLMPFTHTFISLLNFSINFYANAIQINRRCCEWIQIQMEEKKFTRDEIDSNTIVSKSNQVDKKNKIKMKNILKKGKWLNFPSNKYTTFAIISQWIIPVVFSGIFHFGDYKKMEINSRSQEDLTCIFTANFLFENCVGNLQHMNEIFNVNYIESFSSLNNYVSSKDTLLWPNPNSSEVYDMSSKIYDIVQYTMNNSKVNYDKEPSRDHFNITQLIQKETHQDIDNKVATMTINQKHMDKNMIELMSRFQQILKRNYNFLSSDNNLLNIYLDTNAKEFLSSVEKTNNLTTNDKQLIQCMKNRCVISTTFLKIHLFIILILMYFAPIFTSTLLLVISHYKCRDITEKLKFKELRNNPIKYVIEVNNNEAEELPHTENTSTIGWFLSNSDKEIKPNNVANIKNLDQHKKNKKYTKIEDLTFELSCKTEKMQIFFEIFKVNVILAVVLWTPFFLQILTKVFFCSSVPSWLIEITFLATIIFTVLRNAANLNVLKIETDTEHSKKSNSVHPN